MDQTYMKEKPILPLLLSLALPMVISMFVNSLYNIVDSIFVAKISEKAMTALSLVYPIQNLINAIAVGFGVGVNAVIAMHLGAGKHQEADRAATQGLILNVLHGMVLMIVGILIMPSFLGAFTSDQMVIRMGIQYSTIALAFSVIITAGITFEKIFQAVGKMVITMISLMTGCVLNIILDPVLIFGLGPFPKMGIQGAALATGIGQTSALIIYLVVYFLRPIHVKVQKKYWKLEKRCGFQLYAIGIPATLNMALPSFLVSALNGILASFGETYVVVLGVYYKLQTFLYLTANGMIQGMRPLMSYNYGAKEFQRVKKIYGTSFCIVAGIMVVGTGICLAWSQNLMGLFTQNPETLEEGAKALRFICIGFAASAVSVVSAGAFEALGKGIQSFLISLLRYVVVIVPTAYLLSMMLGVQGVWHSFWIAEIVTAVFAWVLYRTLIGQRANAKEKEALTEKLQ